MVDLRTALVPYDERFLDASFLWFQDAELRRLTRSNPVTREGQQAWFRTLESRTDYLIRGVALETEPVGACGLKNLTAGDAEYWGYLGVPSLRGKGIGRWMVAECLAWAGALRLQSVWLRVGVDNPVAATLYRKLGFGEVERSTDEIVMRIPLG